MCANEIAEVRKLIKFLYSVQLAIERVVLRLETIKELSDIVVDLKPALKLLQNVSSDLFQVLPDVSSELNNVQRRLARAGDAGDADQALQRNRNVEVLEVVLARAFD